MAKAQVDGVIEAVHYQANGEILWVRTYLRRGPTWSDRLLIDRMKLLDLLKSGKKIYTGQRCAQLGATFETSTQVEIKQVNQRQVIIAGAAQADNDCLDGVPLV